MFGVGFGVSGVRLCALAFWLRPCLFPSPRLPYYEVADHIIGNPVAHCLGNWSPSDLYIMRTCVGLVSRSLLV